MEKPYTLADLHSILNQYAGKDFGDTFFDQYIYQSQMPDYSNLLESVGIVLSRDPDVGWLGLSLTGGSEGLPIIQANTTIGSPAYQAGLDRGDTLLAINGQSLYGGTAIQKLLGDTKPGDSLQVRYRRRQKDRLTTLIAAPSPTYTIDLAESAGSSPSEKILKARNAWLAQE